MLFTKEEEKLISEAGFDLDSLYAAFEILESDGMDKNEILTSELNTGDHKFNDELKEKIRTPHDAKIFLRPFVQWVRDGNLE
ncbi:MAG: hypothetical protein K5851_04095 [Lachnospiraceae bacterium]|nr:hypothetical protein [Lachnospiraceae bacterium]